MKEKKKKEEAGRKKSKKRRERRGAKKPIEQNILGKTFFFSFLGMASYQTRLPYMNEQLQQALQVFSTQAEKDAKRQVFGTEFPRPQSQDQLQRQLQQGVLQQGVSQPQKVRDQFIPEKKMELIVDLQTNLLIDHGMLKRVLIILSLLRGNLTGQQEGKTADKALQAKTLSLIQRAIKSLQVTFIRFTRRQKKNSSLSPVSRLMSIRRQLKHYGFNTISHKASVKEFYILSNPLFFDDVHRSSQKILLHLHAES